MNEDPLGVKPLWKVLGFFVSFAIIVMILFRQEIMESMFSGLNPNTKTSKVWLAAGEAKEIAMFTLEPAHNDAKFIDVKDLQTGVNTDKGMQLSFRLTNRGDSNDFPNIRVMVRRGAGAAPRIVNFTSKDYQHPNKFDSLIVKLFVPIVYGDTGFTVEAYYEDKAA